MPITALPRRPLILLTVLASLAGCTAPSAGGSPAFDDCFNRPPLEQQAMGCRTGR